MLLRKLKTKMPIKMRTYIMKVCDPVRLFVCAVEDRYTKIYIRCCRIKRNKVVFDNFFGKAYGDNPKYIADEILHQNKKWDLVWLTNDPTVCVPAGIRTVEYGSFKAMREIASAKFFVDNVRNSQRPPKKHGQIYLQTWHGGLGFKKVEGAAEHMLSKSYVAAAKEDGRRCDAILSSCELQTTEYKQFFWLNKDAEILEFGTPRNDILFDEKKASEKKRAVRKIFHISDEKKIILYMPTFRDDGATDGYALDFKAILAAMKMRFCKEFVMLIRLHPNVQSQSSFIVYDDRLMNATKYPDVQELYMAADFLITDYSSAVFDFALLSKPAFLCSLDYEKYKQERGLNEVYESCPFPKAYSNNELIACIQSFCLKDYAKKMKEFLRVWAPFECGEAAKRVAVWMKEKSKES